MKWNIDRNWKAKQITYEGVPLFLRYPTLEPTDSEKKLLPVFAMISHHFSNVTSNGVPEAGYNDSLFAFDQFVREAIEDSDLGLAVLVETFSGKRNYYFYAVSKIDLDPILAKIRSRFPEHEISGLTRPDSEWKFIENYSNQYLRD